MRHGLRRRAWLAVARGALAAGAGVAAATARAQAADWPVHLRGLLARLAAAGGPEFGVHVRDLGSGQCVGHRAEEPWYLASCVKLPVAIAVLRAVERGEITLQTTLTLRAADLVDGAGGTALQRPGTRLSVQMLVERMMIHSDNTASDMLIGLVGIDAVNRLVASLVPEGFAPITTLADVRRLVYGHLSPAATRLSGADFLLLGRARSDAERLQVLGRLLDEPPDRYPPDGIARAYDAYYATQVNSARLDAYADLLALLAGGRALGRTGTAWLLDTMRHAKTGSARIRAGLPPHAVFAHKTGTQRGRVNDAGLVRIAGTPVERSLVLVACTRGGRGLHEAERRLRDIGDALRRSGALRWP